jgi:hypothetical protein
LKTDIGNVGSRIYFTLYILALKLQLFMFGDQGSVLEQKRPELSCSGVVAGLIEIELKVSFGQNKIPPESRGLGIEVPAYRT